MTRFYKNILETVGKTPLVKLTNISKKTGTAIFAKLEFFNPLGSVKDRVALAMIEDAERKKNLQKGSLLIEATSGNTGIALAFISAFKGYRLILTMPETMSSERKKLLESLGAKIILTPGSQGMAGAIKEAEDLLQKTPQGVMLRQFENLANPKIHKKTTAREIFKQMEKDFHFFIAGVGTGGTITGVGEFLKKNLPQAKVVAVEPKESSVLSGGEPGAHKIQGIGAGIIPQVLNLNVCDEICQVASWQAKKAVKFLAKEEGLLVGYSSGAALVAALKISQKKANKGKKIVVLFPDSGERYLSTSLFQEGSDD